MDLGTINWDEVFGPYTLSTSDSSNNNIYPASSWVTGAVSEAQNVTIDDFERLERRVDELEKLIKSIWQLKEVSDLL